MKGDGHQQSKGSLHHVSISQIDEMLSTGVGQMSLNDSQVNELHLGVDTQSIVANELNTMSAQERDHALQELHGVAQLIDESKPGLVDSSLEQMNDEIQKIHPKSAYLKAREIDASYCEDRKFRLGFLRAAQFRPRDAAKRLLTFLEEKSKLFGSKMLCKPVTLEDLDQASIDCIRSGSLQILPGRDRAGRLVVMNFGRIRTFDTEASFLRACFYIFMAAADDEEAQRKGAVAVSYSLGSTTAQTEKTLSPSSVFSVASIMHSIPLRFVGFHTCSDDPTLMSAKSFLALFMGPQTRRTLRFHTGTDVECQYALMTFGIPTSILPVSTEGEVTMCSFHEFLNKRSLLERKRSELGGDRCEPDGILIPGQKDILSGRGKLIQLHAGNLRYRRFVEAYQDRYEKASKNVKTKLVKDIVEGLAEDGWRFLKMTDEGWVKVSDEVAEEKVKHFFRNRRSHLSAKNPAQKESRAHERIDAPATHSKRSRRDSPGPQ